MLNRTAESLFWIGRYMERAENHARLMDVYYHTQQEDMISIRHHVCKWSYIVESIGYRTDFEARYQDYSEENVLTYIIIDKENPNSLLSCISQARHNLRTLREQAPTELWDSLNSCFLWLKEKKVAHIMEDTPHQFLQQVKNWTALFLGTVQSVMPRDNEWYFLESGRMLERTENTLRIVQMVERITSDIGKNNLLSFPFLQALLKSLSGYQTYRKIYLDRFNVECISEFIMFNTKFPRSIQFTLAKLLEYMKGIVFTDAKLNRAHIRILKQTSKALAEFDCRENEALFPALVDTTITSDLLVLCNSIGYDFTKTFFQSNEVSA